MGNFIARFLHYNVLATYIVGFVVKGFSNGETSNNVAPETNSQTFNMSTNHDQVPPVCIILKCFHVTMILNINEMIY